MAGLGMTYTSGVVSHVGEIPSEELVKLKDEIRPYFIELDCNLRVLGSQLGLKTSELNDLDRRSEREGTDLKELLLDECFKKEKITSWHQFVTVLEKPALAQNSITKDIRSRFLRQYSSESDSSLPSPMSIQSAHPRFSSLEASFSSRMEVETGEITLPDAVNVITLKVANCDLHGLGINLGLDRIKVQDVVSYYRLDEQRQRLMELWFSQGLGDEPPMWEKLREALPSCEHSGGGATGESMKSSNIVEIKCRFSALLSNVKSALEGKGVSFERVRQHLIDLFQDLDSSSATNFDELFRGMSLKGYWSYQNHSPVETLIRRFLPELNSLMTDYDNYVEYLCGYYATIKLIPYINLSVEEGSNVLPLQSYTPEQYRKLKVVLDIPHRKITKLSMMYVQDMWKKFAREFDIPLLTAIVGKLVKSSLEITWLLQPYLCDKVTASAHESVQFFREHNIIYIAIDDCPVYDAKLMAIDAQAPAATSYSEVPMSELEEEISHGDVLMCKEASPISMDTSEPGDVESTMIEFDRRFIELSTRTKEELCQKSVNMVYTLLKTLSKRDFHNYVLKMRGRPPESFDELFNDLNTFRWSCFEYELLEAVVVRNNCSTSLRTDMEQHAHNVQKFKLNTTISKLVKHRQYFRNRKFPSKGCKRLRTRHSINPRKSTISTAIDRFQQEVYAKSRCPLHFCVAEVGSVEVEWRFFEEHEHTLVQFFCDDDGGILLEQHHISGVYINDILVDHSLLLLTSATHGDWEAVSALLEDKTKDINLNCLNENGQTVLFYVSAKGERLLDLLKLMLEQGANPNVQDIDGWTSLMKAAKAGCREVIEVFLQRRCEINLQENVHGWSVLHIAANSGQADVVRVILELSSDIDITLKDKDGKTALQLAQEGGYTEVIDLLTSVRDLDQESTRTAESWFSYLEGQFLKLSTEAYSELEFKNNAVVLTNNKQFPEPILNTHHSYVRLSIQKSTIFPNLSVFIRHLNLYCWNFFEHDMLEFLIEQNCSEKLKAKMTNFAKEVNHYLQQTKLTDFINCRCQIIKKMSIPPHFKDMTTEHNIDPNDRTLYDIESFRKELHRSLNVRASECTCVLQMYSVEHTKDRVIVQWIFPEELMDKFFYAEYKELMNHHEIDMLRVDGMSSDSLSFLRAVRGDVDAVNSRLQDVDLDIDVNCCDHNTGCTPINFAAQQGNLEIVEKLFSKGADVNITNKRGRTALMAAVEGGHKEVVKVLLDLETKHLCDTNIQEKALGWTALHFAADKGQKDIIELLIDPILQTDFTIKDKDGRTAAQIAEHKNYTELVEILCPSGTVDPEGGEAKLPTIRLPIQWPSLKRNKLIQAAKRGSLMEVKKLLEKGEHPDSCDKGKWTALLHASHNGYEEIVRVLLEKKADPNWRSADGGYTALILASYRGFVEILELLLQHKADVNIQAKNGSTALQLVCLYSPLREKGHKYPTKRRCEVVRLLLRYGADITLADTVRHRTPLIAASGSGFSDIVRILLEAIKDFSDEEKEAYLNSVMKRSWTALMKASQIGDVNAVKMLMGAGASLKTKAEDGVTALHIAVYNKHTGIVKVLAKKGDPEVLNACDFYGYTPLILAVKANNREAVKVLLQSGADLNLPTKDGKQMTALMFAVQHGYFDIIQMFISNKAIDLLIKDSKQRTAGDMAKNKALRKSLYELQEQRSQELQPVA